MSYAGRSSALNILIVEPDAGLGEGIEQALKKHGINALALDSIDGLASIVQTEAPQLILTECQFAETTGIDLTKQVLEISQTLPEVVLMYQNKAPSLLEAHEAGACHVLKKPVNIEELISIYKRYCQAENQRRFERVIVDTKDGSIDANLLNRGSKEHKINISDIGRGGFYFEMPAGKMENRIGDIVSFELTLTMVPKFSFKAQGIIRWKREGFEKSGAGVEFISLSEDVEKLLEAYVHLFKVKAFVPSHH